MTPLKQGDGQSPFRVGELVGQRGLREVQSPGSRGQSAFFGDRQEQLHMPKLEALRESVHPMNISNDCHENNSLCQWLRDG